MKNEPYYQHGGNPRLDLARLNLTERSVLDFSVNLNPLGTPELLRRGWEKLLEAVGVYPPVYGDGVAHYYREKFGIPSKNFLAGNGSTEMIYLVPRVLGLKRVMILTPSYHDYERASILAGAKVTRHNLSPDMNFSLHDHGDMDPDLNDLNGLWLARPNNPTGILFPKRLILELSDRFPNHMFIVDEAFIQFTDRWADNTLLTEKVRPNILVIHSLTKFYSLAGLRLGGVIGSERVISKLRGAKEPWSVNCIADRVAPMLLDCTDYEEETRFMVARERERVFQRLETHEGITPFPPSANFILCQWTRTRNLDDLLCHLLNNGIYVRDCRNFPGLEQNFFRIGLRTPPENDRLVSILTSFQDNS